MAKIKILKTTFSSVLLGVTAMLCLHTPAQSASLIDEISPLLDDHKRILAARADVAAAQSRTGLAESDWLPDISLATIYGYETQKKGNETSDTGMAATDISASANQLLWDFGSTDASIAGAKLSTTQAELTLSSTKQALLLEGLNAYLEVLRTHKLVQFARESVKNIKHQAELEDSRVQRGSGASTDVLQAKTQLAGAESRLTRALGTFKVASNRYRAVFGHDPGTLEEMSAPMTPFDLLPESLDDAIDTALKTNPGLKATQTGAHVARKDIDVTRADEFLPLFDVTVDANMLNDAEGTPGKKYTNSIMFELSYDFNLGGSTYRNVEVAEQTYLAAEHRYSDEKTSIEEQVRNAWDNLDTARTNAGHLTNQADISAEFLDLARKERQLGNRSLIDVLSGETALINANSDATSARTDVALAVYSLLAAMGELDTVILR